MIYEDRSSRKVFQLENSQAYSGEVLKLGEECSLDGRRQTADLLVLGLGFGFGSGLGLGLDLGLSCGEGQGFG